MPSKLLMYPLHNDSGIEFILNWEYMKQSHSHLRRKNKTSTHIKHECTKHLRLLRTSFCQHWISNFSDVTNAWISRVSSRPSTFCHETQSKATETRRNWSLNRSELPLRAKRIISHVRNWGNCVNDLGAQVYKAVVCVDSHQKN